MNLPQHLEHHLGPIASGWKSDSRAGVQICSFEDQPSPGNTTLTTLGLSSHGLELPDGRGVRQELVAAIADSGHLSEMAQILFHLSDVIILRKSALLAGELVDTGEPTNTRTFFRYMYATVPSVFPETFGVLRDTLPPTVFAWVFPVSAAEAGYIEAHGCDAFESWLERAQPDLFDLHRPTTE